jgi:hypothetical protein
MRSIGGASGSSEPARDVDLEKDQKQKSKAQQPGVRLPAVLVASFLTLFTSSQVNNAHNTSAAAAASLHSSNHRLHPYRPHPHPHPEQIISILRHIM